MTHFQEYIGLLPQDSLHTQPSYLRLYRAYLSQVPPEDLKGISATILQDHVDGLWALMQDRPTHSGPRIHTYHVGTSLTCINIINDDMPFLVDSVTAAINTFGYPVELLIHPVLSVKRTASGQLESIDETPAAGGSLESVMQVHLPFITGSSDVTALEGALHQVLQRVKEAVSDWKPMCDQAKAAADHVMASQGGGAEETQRFIDWMLGNNFTFLGYRSMDLVEGDGGSVDLVINHQKSLGVLKDPAYSLFDIRRYGSHLPDAIVDFLRDGSRTIHFGKSSHKSQVHRATSMDVVSVKRFHPNGQVAGEERFVGLFTSQSYYAAPEMVPILRQKVQHVIEKAQMDLSSHNGKALLHVIRTFPRDELYQISADDLFTMILGILNLQERQRVSLFLREDAFKRFIAAIVFVPHDRYNLEVRKKIESILCSTFHGHLKSSHVAVEESMLTRLYFVIETDPSQWPVYDVKAIETELQNVSRRWVDNLKISLLSSSSPEKTHDLLKHYGDAFPLSYTDTFSAKDAIEDIFRLERLYAQGQLDVHLYRHAYMQPHHFHVRLYTIDNPLSLSDMLPVLECLGLSAVTEQAHNVLPTHHESGCWIHDLEVYKSDKYPIDIKSIEQNVKSAIQSIWRRECDLDSLNGFVVRLGLPWRDVNILRAYLKYLMQSGHAVQYATAIDVLHQNVEFVSCFIKLFYCYFNPNTSREDTATAEQQLRAVLEKVTGVYEDRVLSALTVLLRATLRTNFFQRDDGGQPRSALSFKIRSTDIPFLKEPRPFAEIFVYNTQMESVHLRGGPVARGGIRWSERPEDYRQEVLGLMKAQLVKNALIVPTGSKGGFIVKRPADASPQSLKTDVESAYQTMMHSMLDITDNIAADKSIVNPVDVVRRDGNDPYLVVAADKGTATFSDLANGCAQARHFWLDDAFASGGSVGYDHKAMGITAKGGWEAVKRHFRELGRDIQAEDFTVIGVGDMSGDVFGNGMLLSPHIRLLGAFNHQHIFVDPNPDVAISFGERKRLFETPRTRWTDYRAEALSAGGRVYERNVKEITLTPEIKSCFGIKDDVVHPDFLIQTLLKHTVDLLWFGGIGTFIRAPHETDRDVMDKANDSLRIAAGEVRASVIGEGANLGMTQAARVAAALAGVKLNTDAIDNSGGVDCSDHEVNIKILLTGPVRRGDMTLPQRNDLLASMTDDVAHLVLRNNYLQTQALSSLEYQGTALVHPLKKLMRHLEDRGQLNPTLEGLPTEVTLDARLEQGLGFVRPELAVLLAHSKIALKKDLQGTNLLEEERMLEDVALYFPSRLRERFSEDMKTHPLKKDIIATFTANSMINRMGPHFAFSMQQGVGCEICDVVRAYTIVRESFQLRSLWHEIESLDNKVSAATQHKMLFYTTRLANNAIIWLLRQHTQGTLAVTELVKKIRPLVQECSRIWPDILIGEERAVVEKTKNALIDENVPDSLAQRIAMLRPMMGVLDVIALAEQAGADLSRAAQTYMVVYGALSLHQVHHLLSRLPSPTLWDQQARDALRADLYAAHRDLSARLLALPGTAQQAQTAWMDQTESQRKQFLGMLSQMDEANVRLSNLVVLMRFLKAMVG